MSEQPDVQGPVDFHHPAQGLIKIVDREAGIVEEFTPDGRPRKSVAIVGFAASSKHLAPYDDPEFSIWGVNQLYRHIPRASRWFDIHVNWNEYVVEGTDHAGWIRDAPIPTYMTETVQGLPNSVKFPLARLVQHHPFTRFALKDLEGKDDKNPLYFTSTIAYMMALAIEEGFQRIGLYGIDLIVGQEYDYQKACAEFWIGVAHGKGIQVDIPPTSALCKTAWLYGYEKEPPMWPVKIGDLENRVKYLKNERHKKMMELANIDGALQEAEMWHQMADVAVKSGRRG